MLTKITMPSLSPTMEEGKIVSWIKNVGDEVLSGEVLFEVETDKATMEYEAPEDGFLVKILCEKDQTVKVNDLVAIISESKSIDKNFINEFINEFNNTPKVKDNKTKEDKEDKVEFKSNLIELPNDIRITSLAKRVANQNKIDISSIAYSGRKIKVNDLLADSSIEISPSKIFISPAAKIIAIKKNINIENITGSGPNNRIIIRDVRDSNSMNDNKLRKAIAKATVYSKQNIPHFYLNSRVQMDNLLEFRKLHKQSGNKYSLNGLLMHAISESFKFFPESNCVYLENDEFKVNENIEIGLAVDSDAGLKMPVLKNIETMDLNSLSLSLNALIDSARLNKLTPQDLAGGVISISNLGSFNIRSFDAIIFPGQTYILSVGQIYEDVLVSKGEILSGQFMNLTLACDHRAVDGVLAAKFFSHISSIIEKIK
ncbi:2-oxo acid dehydrogenase subunit E2 [Alphaproteobacteria bacterium]|nr:2-oxo acid dehydrogenase subunit E2 [Alphaproteobacteria bacterium]